MKKTQKNIKYNVLQAAWGYIFGGISIIGLLWFYIVPFLNSFIQTLISTDGGIHWKGIYAYKELFIHSTFCQAFTNTLLMIMICIPLLIVFTVMMTYCMNKLMDKKVRGTAFWFAVHLIPMILPSVVIAAIVKVFFSQYGIINSFLVNSRFTPVSWLGSGWAFWILCFIFLWKNVGYSMVVLLSGVQGIDKEQKEAAALEGANDRIIFYKITLPQLSVFVRFIVVMGLIGIFKLYRESYLILGDSPPDEAYMMQNFLNNNFASLNYERTIIASVLLVVLIGAMLLILFKLTGERHER